MDVVTWAIIALLLTALGGVITWRAFTTRGPLAGAWALGWTLLVPAAWLTGIFTLVARITKAVALWGTRLAFDPTFWIGVVLGGVALALIVVSGLLRRRGADAGPGRRAVAADVPGATLPPAAAGKAGRPSKPARAGADDEFADIEAMLRRRGIQ